jgi:hypothetical protein
MRRRWVDALPLVALVLLVLACGVRKIRAPDYWWQLATGRWIVANGRIPEVDVFTYTVDGAPYLDIHWLFQLGLYGVHALGGHDGVVLAKAALVGLLAAIMASVGFRRDRLFVSAFGVGLALVAANDRLLARPELTSFVLLAAILALLERDTRRRDGWVAAVLPLQLLWVNSHGLYALGIALCGIYTVGAAVQRWRGTAGTRDVARLGLLTGLVVLASFASPHPVSGALYPLMQLGMISPPGVTDGPRFAIGELTPFWFSATTFGAAVPTLVLALLCGAALAASWRHDEERVQHGLVFVAFGGLFVLANRNAAVFAVVAGPLLVRGAQDWLDRNPPSPRQARAGAALVGLALLIAAGDLATGRFYERVHGYHEPGLGYIDLFVAEEAVDWIERERPPGPIAHSMVLGGYLSWRLFPDYRPMIDGRLEVYGPRTLQRLVLRDVAAFRRLDAEFHFGSVVLTAVFDSQALIAWLHARPEWRLVRVDTPAVLFVRVGADGSPEWPEVDVRAPDLLSSPLPGLPIERNAHGLARRRILTALRAVDPAPGASP